MKKARINIILIMALALFLTLSFSGLSFSGEKQPPAPPMPGEMKRPDIQRPDKFKHHTPPKPGEFKRPEIQKPDKLKRSASQKGESANVQALEKKIINLENRLRKLEQKVNRLSAGGDRHRVPPKKPEKGLPSPPKSTKGS